MRACLRVRVCAHEAAHVSVWGAHALAGSRMCVRACVRACVRVYMPV